MSDEAYEAASVDVWWSTGDSSQGRDFRLIVDPEIVGKSFKMERKLFNALDVSNLLHKFKM